MRFPIIAFAIGAAVFPLGGQTPTRPLSDARLHASIAIDPKGNFVYRYTIENGARSRTGIAGLIVDAAHLVPAGLSSPQSGWKAVSGSDAKARWTATQDAAAVAPARTLAGFVITSRGRPSIGRFTLSPHIDPEMAPVMAAGEDPGEVDRYNQEFAQYVESQSIEGMTLVPTAAASQNADAILADLASQVTRAQSLKWIASDAAARSIRGRIDSARAALQRKQFDAAAASLRSLRTDVAAQSGKGMTAELVALVDVNVQTVMQQAGKP